MEWKRKWWSPSARPPRRRLPRMAPWTPRRGGDLARGGWRLPRWLQRWRRRQQKQQKKRSPPLPSHGYGSGAALRDFNGGRGRDHRHLRPAENLQPWYSETLVVAKVFIHSAKFCQHFAPVFFGSSLARRGLFLLSPRRFLTLCRPVASSCPPPSAPSSPPPLPSPSLATLPPTSSSPPHTMRRDA